MAPAGEKLGEVLDQVQLSALKIPVVTNVEACANTAADSVRDLLVRQVSSPVRWQESVAWMVAQGIERFVEIGPGKVLCGLVKRIERSSTLMNIEDLASLKKTVEKAG